MNNILMTQYLRNKQKTVGKTVKVRPVMGL